MGAPVIERISCFAVDSDFAPEALRSVVPFPNSSCFSAALEDTTLELRPSIPV